MKESRGAFDQESSRATSFQFDLQKANINLNDKESQIAALQGV
jgi:hypothetical protein